MNRWKYDYIVFRSYGQHQHLVGAMCYVSKYCNNNKNEEKQRELNQVKYAFA